jgi:hypothetical protein
MLPDTSKPWRRGHTERAGSRHLAGDPGQPVIDRPTPGQRCQAAVRAERVAADPRIQPAERLYRQAQVQPVIAVLLAHVDD